MTNPYYNTLMIRMVINYKNIVRINIRIVVLITCLLSTTSFGQDFSQNQQDFGRPLIKNFTSKDYHLSTEIWGIEQDNRGLMFFGTDKGILEYDGSTWRSITLPNDSIVRSLCKGDDGRIYVTGSSDFGYLAPDSIGQMSYFSLLDYMPKDSEKFGEVWDVVSVSDGIYFKTQDKVFRWDRTQITAINSVDAYRLYVIDDEVYARHQGTGLLKISNDSAILIPDGDKFSDIGVWDMLPFDDRILVTTAQDGLYLYDGQTFSRFKTEADEFLNEGQLYNSCLLSNGHLAFATTRSGVAIIDKNGHTISYLTKDSGLANNAVFDVFQDKQNGLWLATEDGITRVEISSTFSMLPIERTGDARIWTLYRFQNQLFATNTYGLYYLDELNNAFKPVTGIESSGNSYVTIGRTLFASDIDKMSYIDGNNNARMLFDLNNSFLFQSAIDTNIIFAIDRTGFSMFRYKQGTLVQPFETLPIDIELEWIAEDGDGSLWLKTSYEGIFHMRSSAGNFSSTTNSNQITLELYNKDNGFPGDSRRIFTVEGKTRFATNMGLFCFNQSSKTFVPDSLLGKNFANGTYIVLELEKDHHGNLWIWTQTPVGNELGKAVKQDNGMFNWQADPKFRRLDLNNVLTIYPDYIESSSKDILWVSTNDGLFRYKLSDSSFHKTEFPTVIRSVTVNEDSLIYGGTAHSGAEKPRVLTANTRNILFRFTAVSYDKTEVNQFQYRLKGNDEAWSSWTKETQKAYTNLSAGDYVFHVHSKNVYGNLGTEDKFTFTILPPWYLSWEAYVVYALMFLGFLFQARRWELKRVNKKHAVQLQLQELSKLKELDQLKSQFFANISHEFRTPLTLILGQLDSLQTEQLEKQGQTKLQVAYRNARRLLRLINELLDLSKLEAGGIELRAEVFNMVTFLKNLVSSFESLAEQKRIELKFSTEVEFIPVKFEPDKIEKVFYNLLSNAFKFTPENGNIRVDVRGTLEVPRTLEINIKDSGIGISEDDLPNIFDRFYQVDGSHTREHEGSGIGLALAKELIELHNGQISVSSKEDVGTTFTVRLPVSETESQIPEKVEIKPEDTQIEADTVQLEQDKSIADSQLSDNQEIILIAEDNDDVRVYIREQLQEHYNIVETEDGEQGLAKAQEIIPDLLITDVMMPKMDGYQLSKHIRDDEKTSHIPIVMITARADMDDKIEGLETGVDAYLVKPFNARELKVRIKNLIQQRQKLRKRFKEATIIKPSEVTVTPIDQLFLENVISTIEKKFSNEDFNVEALADSVHMSASQINRKLGALIDQSGGQFIRSMRLQRAADLLKQNAGTVAEICYEVGFSEQSTFTRAFKKQFGLSPREYRKNG